MNPKDSHREVKMKNTEVLSTLKLQKSQKGGTRKKHLSHTRTKGKKREVCLIDRRGECITADM